MRKDLGHHIRSSTVSIRARHCWRAMRFTTNALPVLYFFLFSRERLFDHSTGQTDLCEQGGKA
jgi:hypothetical protein